MYPRRRLDDGRLQFCVSLDGRFTVQGARSGNTWSMTVTAVTVPEPGAAGFVLLGVAAIIGGRILRGTIRVARRAAPIVG